MLIALINDSFMR